MSLGVSVQGVPVRGGGGGGSVLSPLWFGYKSKRNRIHFDVKVKKKKPGVFPVISSNV